jgi:hypothetical protein
MGAKLSEVISSLWYNVVEEFENDFTSFVSSEVEIEEYFRL